MLVDRIRSRLEHARLVAEALASQSAEIAAVAAVWTDALREGRTLFLFGNGGSAADAQHIAGELVGRYLRERDALPAIALTTNGPILTAIGNDYGFEHVFARQIRALGRPGDVAVGLSTSGASANVIAAIREAHARGLATVGLTGALGGPLADLADCAIRVPARETPRIQEAHLLIGHILCELVEQALFPDVHARA
ncbi:MAG: D-sedoheptulose 7-phosphate isomerase [Armatimonadetes bacterium]|nr:D-sedoheptulose 7-phosphate isomerase [Armatimonadota bacterium]